MRLDAEGSRERLRLTSARSHPLLEVRDARLRDAVPWSAGALRELRLAQLPGLTKTTEVGAIHALTMRELTCAVISQMRPDLVAL